MTDRRRITAKASRLAIGLAGALLVMAIVSSGAVAQDKTTIYTFQADGLACPFCAYSIEKQVRKIRGVGQIDIDIGRGLVSVTMAGGTTLDEDTARAAVEASGFSFRDFQRVGK